MSFQKFIIVVFFRGKSQLAWRSITISPVTDRNTRCTVMPTRLRTLPAGQGIIQTIKTAKQYADTGHWAADVTMGSMGHFSSSIVSKIFTHPPNKPTHLCHGCMAYTAFLWAVI
ncbi:hypothetical protein RRG08_031982 [Elysia crispata]|uniref:Uncharacterized protein n=1 Tax=Elysia crispata TaxID=231223 RepID=A0AAE0Z5E6_9GAST|nr:hypothetical protein RRG08_031982 [Elysia crispata]